MTRWSKRKTTFADATGPLVLIESGREHEKNRFQGVFAIADKINLNGRKYPKTILERAVKEIMPLVREGKILGSISHPKDQEPCLQGSAFKVLDLHWVGNELIGEAELLDTSAGRDLRAILEAGIPAGISSRGSGVLVKKDGYEEVTAFDLLTFDAVLNPSSTKQIELIEQVLETSEAVPPRRFSQIIDMILQETLIDEIQDRREA